eukprot:TRINITY_DN4041_c0_g1_i1.p1 TRINITY_DN4041_c0_g1~~TRINITY_DN4041_c0_g1_i1.p1  ORF type:complete len:103 (+),score=9.87 TRINITY_DN4041_c0_g1_i1:44-352(+)
MEKESHCSGQEDLPVEVTCGSKFDRCVENFLINSSVGLGIGLLSFLVFRKKWRRGLVMGISVGTAWGISVGDCLYDIHNPLLLHGKRISRTVPKESITSTSN